MTIKKVSKIHEQLFSKSAQADPVLAGVQPSAQKAAMFPNKVIFIYSHIGCFKFILSHDARTQTAETKTISND